ncbi:MAG TPA: winged helix-turn-helix domain-containing protein [Nitrososphaeraceae archaeon]|jgi:predicted transcriptional regulator|nr:winged helix-turn-helix domain-containing protein [Nitrososphaeraceae archaeon]
MKNRDRAEINAMILDIASHGRVTKTKIMYRAYLSYNKLEEYLDDLEDNELLEYEVGAQTYRTTEKGKRYLEIHSRMNELISIDRAVAF